MTSNTTCHPPHIGAGSRAGNSGGFSWMGHLSSPVRERLFPQGHLKNGGRCSALTTWSTRSPQLGHISENVILFSGNSVIGVFMGCGPG
jgi:hypothetical protein